MQTRLWCAIGLKLIRPYQVIGIDSVVVYGFGPFLYKLQDLLTLFRSIRLHDRNLGTCSVVNHIDSLGRSVRESVNHRGCQCVVESI